MIQRGIDLENGYKVTLYYNDYKNDKEKKKKKRELFFFLKLIEKKIYPEKNLIVTESEEPDYLLKEKNIGIEVVEFYKGINTRKGNKLKKEEARQWRIINRVKEKFEEISDAKIDVKFYWNKISSQKIDEHELVKEILDKVMQNIPNVGKTNDWELNPFNIEKTMQKYPEFYKLIYSLRIYNPESYKKNFWSFNTSGFLSPEYDKIKEIIQEKDRKIKNYREKANKIYLLICSNGFSEINTLDKERLEEEIKQRPIKTNFEKVFYINTGFNEFIEIK